MMIYKLLYSIFINLDIQFINYDVLFINFNSFINFTFFHLFINNLFSHISHILLNQSHFYIFITFIFL